MNPDRGILFSKEYTTIEDSILSFLFKDLIIFGFPKSPRFLYVMRPFFLIMIALLILFGDLDTFMKEISIILLIISALSIMYARKKQKKYDLQQAKINKYRQNRKYRTNLNAQ